MNSRFDYTILDAINNAFRTSKAAPLVLGATSSGAGGPPGGYVGYLYQGKVSYDPYEVASSGVPESGISLIDNLNHIRYRLGAIESGGTGASSFLDLTDTPNAYTGSIGKAVIVNATEDGLEFATVSGLGSSLAVSEFGGSTVSGVYHIVFSGMSVTDNGLGQITVTQSGIGIPDDYILIQRQEANSTEGGTNVEDVWTDLNINTEVIDSSGLCTLASGQFTIESGIYYMSAQSTFWNTNQTCLRLYNVTDATEVLVGVPGYANSFSSEIVSLFGKFELTSSKTLSLQYICEAVSTDLGLGTSTGSRTLGGYTGVEIYTSIELIRQSATNISGGGGGGISVVTSDTTLDGDGTISSPLSRAELVGAITAASGSNTTALGSFTNAELNTALSDNNLPLVPASLVQSRVVLTDESTPDSVRTSDLAIFTDTYGLQIGDTQGQGMANVNLWGNTGNALAPNSSSARIDLIEYSDGTNGALFKGITANGTKAAPTPVASGQPIAMFRGGGYGDTGNVWGTAISTGGVDVVADEIFSDTTKGTRLDFYTTPNGSITREKAVSIGSNGSTAFIKAPDIAYTDTKANVEGISSPVVGMRVIASDTPEFGYYSISGWIWSSGSGGVGSGTWGSIAGTLSDQTDLQSALDGKVDDNSPIFGDTKTKITFDAKGLVTSGVDATTADIADSTDRRYVTDLDLVDIGNLSGVNTGDNAVNSLYSGLVQYTDEMAQDAVGAMIDSSLVYVDSTPLLQRAALTGAITASAGSNTTALGSFTTAQLNTALSDNDIATGGGTATGTNTGDQDLSGLQPLDADLTAIAGLAPANDDVIQRKAGAWINRTIAQLTTDIRAVIDSVYVALTGDQTVAGVKTFTSAPTIAPPSPTDGTDLLKFTTERAWTLQQFDTGGTAKLEFFSDTAGKYMRINPNSVNAGGLIVADSMPTGTLERFMVEGTGNIKGQVSTLSSTGYAFQRLKNDTGQTFDFGQNSSARTGTVFGLNNSTGGVGLSFAAPSSSPLAIGTLGAFDLYFGTNGVIRAQIDSSGNIYLGGSTTNAVKIAPGGELTLIGTATRWNDLRVEPVVRTTGAKAPTFTAYKTNVYLYDFDNAVLASEKEIFFTVQLPHDWKEGSTIYPHVHWVNRTTGTAGHVVKWAMDYTKAKIGATFGATSNISGTAIVGGGDITVADEHMVTSLTAITMTGDTISTVLVCRAYRNSSDAADTYTGTAGLLYVDFHYEIDTIGGSADEFTK